MTVTAIAAKKEYRVWHPWTVMRYLTRDSALHLNIDRAEGSAVYSRDGFRFIDASAGLWNVSLGHGRADVIDAVSEQLRELTYLCNIELRSFAANDLANAILRHAPPHLTRVMFHCTGTAAVEGAVLLVRQQFRMTGQPQRTKVVSIDHSYHGCSLLGVALSGDPNDHEWMQPLPDGFRKIAMPLDDESARLGIEQLRELVRAEGDQLACFVFEPVMGVAGVIELPAWWLDEVFAICKDAGMRIIADEVTTAFGRVGAWFACQDERVDVIAVGKGMSGGYVPLAATLYREELFVPFNSGDDPPPFKYGSTMDGYPAACAAGLAVLSALEREDLIARAAAMGERLMHELRPLEALSCVGPIRGRGLMIGVPLLEIDGGPLRPMRVIKIVAELITAGLLIHPTESALALLPPLTIPDDDAAETVRILRQVLERFDMRAQRKRKEKP